MVNVTTTNKLIRSGRLATVKVYGAKSKVDVEGLKTVAGDWVRKDVGERTMQIVGDIVPEWKQRTMEEFGRPEKTIVFCPSVADCDAITERFNLAGYDFRAVHYKMTEQQNADAIAAFRRGGHIGLVSCVSLTKGFDVPDTRILVDAYATQSFSRHIQKRGRVMRTAPNKPYGIIIDHTPNSTWHFAEEAVFFDEGCNQLDDGKKKKQKKESKKERKELECKGCGRIFAPGLKACPECGWIKPRRNSMLVELPGELTKIATINGKPAFEGNWWHHICARSLAIGRDHDHARKLAFATYRGIFNRWPNGKFRDYGIHCDPIVEKVCQHQYRKWKRKQSKFNQRAA